MDVKFWDGLVFKTEYRHNPSYYTVYTVVLKGSGRRFNADS